MAIGVKGARAPIKQTSYVRATLSGMALTLKHLLDPDKVTIQYPEQKMAALAAVARHAPHADDEEGKAKCVACGLCPTVCPSNCIKLVPGEDENGIAIRSCSRSTSSAASSAAIARKSVRKERSTSDALREL
jgi:NADH-quinone oxidoreductase subunit I